MRRILSAPLAAALVVLWTTPTQAWASSSRTQGLTGPDEDDDLVVIDEDEMEGAEDAPAGDAPPPADEGGLFGDDAGDKAAASGEPAAKQDKDSENKQIKAEMGLISVVQRQRMLKKKRFELTPQFGISVNDPYVRHYTLGLDMNYWFTNRIALGLTGTGFIGAKTPRYDNIRFQEGLLLTANETLWQASVNFTYNPFYGKIAIFNRWLLHWEGSIVLGGGATQTRVIPRYESIHDPFTTLTGGGVIGLNSRFYTSSLDWLAVDVGVRTWIYADKLEPANRGPATSAGGTDDPTLDDPDEARAAADFQVAYSVVVHLGVSFFFPTSFKYSTPR